MTGTPVAPPETASGAISTTTPDPAAGTTTEPGATGQATTTDTTQTGDPDALGDPGKAALAAERRAKAAAERRAKTAEDALKAIKDAELSEVDRAKQAATEALERATKAELDAVRYRVATKKQVPEWLVDRLQGTTEEEISADADRVLAGLKAAGAGAPRPDLSQGGTQTSTALNGDPLVQALKSKLNIP